MPLPIVTKATIESTAASIMEVDGVSELRCEQKELTKFMDYAASNVITAIHKMCGQTLTHQEAFLMGFVITYKLLQRQQEAKDLEESMG